MDWKTKLVLPPNYVTLRHLKELREKEKAELELKQRHKEEAEEKLRIEEERRRVEEEKKKLEEKERLRREFISQERLRKSLTILWGEPSDVGDHQVLQDENSEDKKQITKEFVKGTVDKEENLKEGKKMKWEKKKDYEKDALEIDFLEGNETLNSERNYECEGTADKIVINQRVDETSKIVGDEKNKTTKKSKAVEKLPQPQMGYYSHFPKNFNKHGKHIDSATNPGNASCSSLVWVAKTDKNR